MEPAVVAVPFPRFEFLCGVRVWSRADRTVVIHVFHVKWSFPDDGLIAAMVIPRQTLGMPLMLEQ